MLGPRPLNKLVLYWGLNIVFYSKYDYKDDKLILKDNIYENIYEKI